MATQFTSANDTGPDLDAFIAFLREEETRSYDTQLADERAVALDFYNGKPFGDEDPNRSQVVTRDVAEVVDYMTVSLLRTMISGDKVVEFECPDKAVSEQATLAVSQTFFQGQRGYQFLHDWIKAGLLEKASTAKVCVEKQDPKRFEATLSADEMTALQEAGARIVAAEPDPSQGLDEIGQPVAFNVAWHEQQPPKFRDYVVPNEQSSFAQDATDLDDDAVYVGFHLQRTLSQLAKLGFETDGVADNQQTVTDLQILALARDDRSQWNRFIYNRDGANRAVIHHEEYVRYDLNNDGVAELMLVHRVGNTILRRKETGLLAIDVLDEQPGVSWCPFPMQHRIVGQSLADKVMDIQRTASVLTRQMLDNLYQTNAPRWTLAEASMGDTTIDDLLTVRPGGIIRHTGTPPVPVDIQANAATSLQGLEFIRGEKESRTGITRMNQGLDADALNKTATGTALQMASGQQIEEYLARNFAEAFARLMLKKYRLMRAHGQPFQMVIDGEPVMIDPSKWPEDMQVMVRVGLGTGRKDQRIAYRMQLLQIMQGALAGGSKAFTDENVYNNVKGMIADMSLGSARELSTDPATVPPTPEKPDPATLKVQAEAQQKAQQLQFDQQQAAAKNQLDLEQMHLQAGMDQQRLDYELQAKREAAALDATLAQNKADLDAQLARERLASEIQLELLRLQQEKDIAEKKAVDLPENRPGGRVDA